MLFVRQPRHANRLDKDTKKKQTKRGKNWIKRGSVDEMRKFLFVLCSGSMSLLGEKSELESF
jgi:lipopolysaccharide/colanic/teichoic acid biosynthesis glycosyltransferase